MRGQGPPGSQGQPHRDHSSPRPAPHRRHHHQQVPPNQGAWEDRDKGASKEEARGGQDEDTEGTMEREGKANQRRAGSRQRAQEMTWGPDPDSAATQPDPLATQPRLLCGGDPQRGESLCWAHGCWDVRSACSRLCNALPFPGVPHPSAFQKPHLLFKLFEWPGAKWRGF